MPLLIEFPGPSAASLSSSMKWVSWSVEVPASLVNRFSNSKAASFLPFSSMQVNLRCMSIGTFV